VPPEPPSNRLLQLLDTDARAALSPVAVSLQSRDVLYEPGTPSLYAYFPVSAVISLVPTIEDGASSEVALIGREGMVGLSGVLGTRGVPKTSAPIGERISLAFRVKPDQQPPKANGAGVSDRAPSSDRRMIG
jgi:hypothetical protein